MTFKGFTLVETLITLGIIGVVSAITLPVLINKIQDRQFAVGRQKALKSVGEAGRIIAIEGNINEAIDSEDFVKNYLSKHLKIVKYCDNNPTDCGFSDTIDKMGSAGSINISDLTMLHGLNSKLAYKPGITMRNMRSYSIMTANGYSAIVYYNPECTTLVTANSYAPLSVCMNVVYDMNGKRLPNKVGKDIGWVTVMGNNESSVAVAPLFQTVSESINGYLSEASALTMCKDKGITFPDYNELLSAAYNKSLTDFSDDFYFAATIPDNIRLYNGTFSKKRTYGTKVRCVIR